MNGFNVNSKELDYAMMIASGLKTIETRNTNSLKSHIGERMYIVKTGTGVSEIIGSVIIGEPKVYKTIKSFNDDYSHHRISRKSKYYIKRNSIKYGYPMIDPVVFNKTYPAPKGGIVIRKNILLEIL